jgi:hypothetical protein
MAWLVLGAVLGVVGTLAIYAAIAAVVHWRRGARRTAAREISTDGLADLTHVRLAAGPSEAATRGSVQRLVPRLSDGVPRVRRTGSSAVPKSKLSRAAPTDAKTLRDLRRRYIEAAQLCERCAEVMEEHTSNGTTPSEDEIRTQRDARHDLIAARRAFLEGLALYKLTL